MYTAAGKEIARRLHEASGANIDVWLMSQEGRPLDDPWKVVIWHDGNELHEMLVRKTLYEVLGQIPELTESMLYRQVRLM